MSSELIYTDGSCNGNGKSSSSGGFGVFIKKSKLFNAPVRINRKGEHTRVMGKMTYVTNIRMEGLAIVSTLALYAKHISTGEGTYPVDILNSFDPYDPEVELPDEKKVDCKSISIVSDSQFWINVITSWMPTWIRKGILLEKKNPDILLMLQHYVKWYKDNDVKIDFIFVRSHQKGQRSFHADDNDVVDILAKDAASNSSSKYEAHN